MNCTKNESNLTIYSRTIEGGHHQTPTKAVGKEARPVAASLAAPLRVSPKLTPPSSPDTRTGSPHRQKLKIRLRRKSHGGGPVYDTNRWDPWSLSPRSVVQNGGSASSLSNEDAIENRSDDSLNSCFSSLEKASHILWPDGTPLDDTTASQIKDVIKKSHRKALMLDRPPAAQTKQKQQQAVPPRIPTRKRSLTSSSSTSSSSEAS